MIRDSTCSPLVQGLGLGCEGIKEGSVFNAHHPGAWTSLPGKMYPNFFLVVSTVSQPFFHTSHQCIPSTCTMYPPCIHNVSGTGEGGLYKLEFSHFKFCTKILCAICSVFLRICAGNKSRRPLFLMSNYWEPYIICSLIFKKWHRLCRARICRFIFSPARNIPPPPPGISMHVPLLQPFFFSIFVDGDVHQLPNCTAPRTCSAVSPKYIHNVSTVYPNPKSNVFQSPWIHLMW